MKISRRNSHFLIFIGDILLIPLSFILGFYLRFGTFKDLPDTLPFFSLLLITLGYVIVLFFFNQYALRKKYLNLNALLSWFLGILTAAVIVSFLNYGLFLNPIGRGIFTYANIGILILAYLWRLLFHHLLKYIFHPKRVVIIGGGERGLEIFKVLQRHATDFECAGYLDTEPGKDSSDGEMLPEYFGKYEDLLSICVREKIGMVISALPDKEGLDLGPLLMDARLKGLEVSYMLDLYQGLEGRIPIDLVTENWFLKARGFDWSETSTMFKVKRLMDVMIACLILLIFFPLCLLIALLIKLTSRGPVFYRQERVGQNDRLFFVYKFRSMVDKAEENGAVWAQENDTRVTRLGRILRKLHLDELPQLINVFKGDMSIVGARPERPVFVEEFKNKIPYYSLRHFLRPGLTGWAQVNYPYASSIEASREKLEYDLYYVYHMNLLFDLRILFKTAQNIIRKIRGRQ